MKIIVDTNVLVSAILRDRDPELVIQFIVKHPDFEWVASPEILAEYQAVLARPKFRLSQKKSRCLDDIIISRDRTD